MHVGCMHNIKKSSNSIFWNPNKSCMLGRLPVECPSERKQVSVLTCPILHIKISLEEYTVWSFHNIMNLTLHYVDQWNKKTCIQPCMGQHVLGHSLIQSQWLLLGIVTAWPNMWGEQIHWNRYLDWNEAQCIFYFFVFWENKYALAIKFNWQ